jgi:hypothetical protein
MIKGRWEGGGVFLKFCSYKILFEFEASVKLNAKIFNFVRYTKIMFLKIGLFSVGYYNIDCIVKVFCEGYRVNSNNGV